MTPYLLPAFFSFILTLALTFGALKFFPKIGFMDRPHKYNLKRSPIPYYGGLAIIIGFVVSVFLFVKLDSHLVALLTGALLIACVSFFDDRYGLSPWLRLVVQIVAALILVFAGIGIHSLSNPLDGPITLDSLIVLLTLDKLYSISVFSALFTVVWVVGLINTLNWTDGLQGLPSGVSAIAALTIFLLSIRPGIHYDLSSQAPVAMMSIILFGSCLAFWLFDFHPAKILMGDTGSMFLGFLLATLAIFSGGKVATAFLVLGFPILDFVWVIIRRIVQGKAPWRGDLKHLHHRLLEVGLSERKALLLIYLLCAGFGFIAVYLEGISKLYALIVLLGFMVAVGGMAVYLSKRKQKYS